MGRRRLGPRVLGPYESPERNAWRIIIVDGNRQRYPKYFSNEFEAKKAAEDERRKVYRAVTIEKALAEYERHLMQSRKPDSVEHTLQRLRVFFPYVKASLSSLKPRTAHQRYQQLAKKYAVDTHRNILNETRSFVEWVCKFPRCWLTHNPLNDVTGVGRRKQGKPQLAGRDEAAMWTDEALRMAREASYRHQHAPLARATAALLTLFAGLRAGEVVRLRVCDLDADCRVLRVAKSKTDAGLRRLDMPEFLAELLLELCEGKKPDARVFPSADTNWVSDAVGAICKRANLPRVTAHGMRGLHATLAMEAGSTPQLVAQSLGHASSQVTERHYAKPGSKASAQARKVMRVLAGGK